MHILRSALRLLLPLFTAAVCLCAQARPTLATVPFRSRLMGAREPFDIILPAGYSTSTRRYPVLYLLHGLGGHYDSWVKNTRVVADEARYPLIIVMPEGGTGFFIDGSRPHSRWASYILEELIPYVDAHYRTVASRRGRAIAGVSMGGYGALRFGIEDPERFIFAAGLSPALVAQISDTRIRQMCLPCDPVVRSDFGPTGSARRKGNELQSLLATAAKTRLPFLFVSCGTEDSLLRVNRAFSGLLDRDHIPHEYVELPGTHGWTLWNRELPYVLHLLAARWHWRTRTPR